MRILKNNAVFEIGENTLMASTAKIFVKLTGREGQTFIYENQGGTETVNGLPLNTNNSIPEFLSNAHPGGVSIICNATLDDESTFKLDLLVPIPSSLIPDMEERTTNLQVGRNEDVNLIYATFRDQNNQIVEPSLVIEDRTRRLS